MAVEAVVVRAAQEADLPRLLQLYQQLYPEHEPADERVAAAVWAAITATPGRVVLVAELGSALIGTADLAVMANLAHWGESYLLVENVVVDRTHRRRGIGAALLAVAAEHGRATGCYKMQLSADEAEAFSFYEAAGWQHLARTYKRYLGG